ncbi:hypothetical protein [Bythopirellula polymerisocia]|uniref:Translocation protein TolB n=1 Tax=Bythopirellula polymerisocia TaxID=2528003 RepID=A0A5C6CWQ1_9BACT|nr:hypothetical protein [Bythopirellula polymerisocia]TWU28154.1 translocation protein TolB [Bythopirellula polymerisocia]
MTGCVRRCGALPISCKVLHLIAAALWIGTSALAASPIKLNGPLVTGGSVIPEGLQFSPDSSRVLYLADQTTDNVNEIFSVSSTGGLAIKLNGLLPPGGNVFSEGLQFSPNSSRVLYLADQLTNNVNELFSVPSGGGIIIRLNGSLVANGDVFSTGLQFSPDSSRVLYRADQVTDTVNEIFIVPSAGGFTTKLNGQLVLNGDVSSSGLQFSPDSSRVLYLADQTTSNVNEVFSVPSTGGFATKLNGPLAPNGDVSAAGVQFSPDSSRVLYLADQVTNGVAEIFSVPSGGGIATKLNGPLTPNGDVSSAGLQFSPDSSRVLYLADQITNDVDEIFSVPSGGGFAIKLNGMLAPGGNVDPNGLQFSPDSTRVLYLADQTTNDVFEIFSVPSLGGTATKLNGALVSGGNVDSAGLQFSPDSTRVLYLADQTTNDVNELYIVPSAGGMATKLSGTLVAGGNVVSEGLEFSPDSSRVIYMADQSTDNVNEIFIVPSAGGTAVKLNGPLGAGGNVLSHQLSPDGSLVLYLADQNVDNVNEIFVRIVRQHANGGEGAWDSGTAWNHGGEPDEAMQIFVDAAGTVTASGDVTRIVNELFVGGGTEASTLALSAGAEITSLHGATINAGGVFRGDGVLVADLLIAAGGVIRAGSSEQLNVRGTSVSNAGLVEAIGTTVDPAEIWFEGAATNNATTGRIFATNALLRFDGGLSHDSTAPLSFDATEIRGDVVNSASGTISIVGDSTTTFFDDVTNNGTINVASGSTAVFAGSLSGNGSEGSGEIQILGELTPGTSLGMMSFGGDLNLGSLGNLVIELGGLTAGSLFDQLVIAGDATLAGTLDVSLFEGFTLAAGQQFEILDVEGSLTGNFAGLPEGSLLGNFGGTNLFVSYAGGDGNDVTLFATLPGDFDLDGDVDGRDFLVWQRGGSPNGINSGDLALWQAQYGNPPPLAQSLQQDNIGRVVPEPGAVVLIALGLVVMNFRERSA